MDIDGAIRRSDIEAPHYELKQGILRLDAQRQIDPGILDKIMETICAIANNGPERSGLLLLGVADGEDDISRIESLDGIAARMVGRKGVVGIRREADHLNESVESYFVRIKEAIASSDLSEPLRAAVLSGMSFNDYFGMGVTVINVPAQNTVSTLGERVFVRQGDSTVEVTGTGIVAVTQRF
jgi:predicted HTH transcriptional regulator